jgi:hypothetical protein
VRRKKSYEQSINNPEKFFLSYRYKENLAFGRELSDQKLIIFSALVIFPMKTIYLSID